MKKRTRWMRFLLVLDQMFNVLIWNGSQDETISSTSIEGKKKALLIDLITRCWVLKKFESEHCLKSLGE